MKTSKLDYDLPKELIAQKPATPRDAAKLLVFDRKSEIIQEDVFRNLTQYLRSDDVLVFNKTKVFPARTHAIKKNGKKVEVLFLKEIKNREWEILVRGSVGDGEELFFDKGLRGKVSKKSGIYLKVNKRKKELFQIMEEIGHMPLPPYIKRNSGKSDEKNYQTVFAQKVGSAAAPTASLHFTSRLIADLKKHGIQIEFVALHVGLGTFAPVKTEKVEAHPIHTEYYEIDSATAKKLNKAKSGGKRIIACGTTVVRTLESSTQLGKIITQKGDTDLFIYPGYKFKFVDAMITNFHTPKSSLLALVFAFAGEKKIKKIYKFAIRNKYRFFSYGDGMLIT